MREANYKISADIYIRDNGGVAYSVSSEGRETELGTGDFLRLDQ